MLLAICICKRSRRRTRRALETGGADTEEAGRTKVWAVGLAWGWDSCLSGGDGLGSAGSPGKVLAAPTPVGCLEGQPSPAGVKVRSGLLQVAERGGKG